MKLEQAKGILRKTVYEIISEGRLPNDTGYKLVLDSGAMVNIYDTGKYNVQGKEVAPVKAALQAGLAGVSKDGTSKKPPYNRRVSMVHAHGKEVRNRDEKITVFCDGACSGNQFDNNIGGWGAVLSYKDNEKRIYGGERDTSNQRMELTACIMALEGIKTSNIHIVVYSDSAYLVNGMKRRWYKNWEKNSWMNIKGQPVANQDLWMRLMSLVHEYKVSFHKVTGHSGIDLNETADALAKRGIEEYS